MKLSATSVVKLDLSPGIPQPGFISLSKKPLNPLEAALRVEKKLPFKDNEITLIMAGQLVEHIEPRKFIGFMNECWRILKEGGQMMISTPYGSSTGFYADPTHINPCNAQTWYYFDPTNVTGLYETYKPHPWKVDRCFFQSDGLMETLLVKIPYEGA